jgi:hypothetical protein
METYSSLVRMIGGHHDDDVDDDGRKMMMMRLGPLHTAGS